MDSKTNKKEGKCTGCGKKIIQTKHFRTLANGDCVNVWTPIQCLDCESKRK